MKPRLLYILIILISLSLLLVGCGSGNTGEPDPVTTTTIAPPATTTTPPTTTESLSYDFYFQLNEDGESYKITGLWGDCADVLEIPAEHEGKPVTVIGQSALGCSNISGVIIPASVHTIESTAFTDCTNLISVTIPGTVKTIEMYAFQGCSSLAELTIEEGVESIGDGAFMECSALTQVTIPGTVKTVDRYAFQYCSQLASVTICDGVESVDDCAFANCDLLTQVDLPDNGEIDLYPSAFEDSACFNDPANWEKGVFYLDHYLIRVEKEMFDSSQYPMPYTVREGTVSIAAEAFFNINGTLYQIKLPNTLKYIGRQAFCGTNIDHINIPGSVRYIANEAFMSSQLESVSIAEGMEYIGSRAFECYNLTSISFPASVTYIDKDAITGRYVTALEVRKGNTTYHSAGNCIIETATGTLILGCKGSTIPANAGVKHIGESAFASCKLTKIVIPEGVVSIGAHAFDFNPDAESLTLPQSLERIEDGAFTACSQLTKLTIPANVVFIGKDAFSGCKRLEKVAFEEPNGWALDGKAVDMSDMSAILAKLIAYAEYDENATWTRAE